MLFVELISTLLALGFSPPRRQIRKGLALVHPCPSLPGVAASAFTIDHCGVKFMVYRLEKAEVRNLRFFWKRRDGSAYASLSALRSELTARGERLVFAMNGGIFSKSMEPSGLYVEQGDILSPLNLGSGAGNFYFKPNGVFCITSNEALIVDSELYAPDVPVCNAVQSGPLLVRDGQLNPRIFPGNRSRQIRNGVGVDREGRVAFVFSEGPINLHGFGTIFRNNLDCPNALALDGQVSRMYLPERGYFAFWPWRKVVSIIGLSKPVNKG